MADYGTYADESPDASIGEKVTNAIRKTVKDVADLTAPRSITQIKPRHDQQESDTISRMRSAQSTDENNQYVY